MTNNCRFIYFIISGLILINSAFSYGYKPKTEKKEKTSQKDSAENGGIGFEKIAKSLGWKTNESHRPPSTDTCPNDSPNEYRSP